jgi:hypothetical protein
LPVRLLPGFALALILTALLLWPAVNNIKAGYWAPAIIFLLLALIPGVIFWFASFSNYRRSRKYIEGTHLAEATKNQIDRIRKDMRRTGEKIARKIMETKALSGKDSTLKEMNLFLTPREYEDLLKKTTTELPPKK